MEKGVRRRDEGGMAKCFRARVWTAAGEPRANNTGKQHDYHCYWALTQQQQWQRDYIPRFNQQTTLQIQEIPCCLQTRWYTRQTEPFFNVYHGDEHPRRTSGLATSTQCPTSSWKEVFEHHCYTGIRATNQEILTRDHPWKAGDHHPPGAEIRRVGLHWGRHNCSDGYGDRDAITAVTERQGCSHNYETVDPATKLTFERRRRYVPCYP